MESFRRFSLLRSSSRRRSRVSSGGVVPMRPAQIDNVKVSVRLGMLRFRNKLFHNKTQMAILIIRKLNET